jgi:hypothetical protein
MLLMLSAHPLIVILSVALGVVDWAAGDVENTARVPAAIHAVTLLVTLLLLHPDWPK